MSPKIAKPRPLPASLVKRARRIRLLALDVDGVLTDGGLYYGAGGELFKRFDVQDGHGIVMCRLLGLPAAILTARTSRIVQLRAKELGIAHVLQGKRDKGAALAELVERAGVAASEIAYIGDDVNDLPVLRAVGLSACPTNARPEVHEAVDYVCQRAGGNGAVRELCELVLRAQKKWGAALALHGRFPGAGKR